MTKKTKIPLAKKTKIPYFIREAGKNRHQAQIQIQQGLKLVTKPPEKLRIKRKSKYNKD